MSGPEGNHLNAHNGPAKAPPAEVLLDADRMKNWLDDATKLANTVEALRKDPVKILSEGQKIIDATLPGNGQKLLGDILKIDTTPQQLAEILQGMVSVKSSAEVTNLVVDYMLNNPAMVQKAVDFLPAGGKLRLKERGVIIQRALGMYGDVKGGNFDILKDSGKAIALAKDINAELGDSAFGSWIRGKIKDAAYAYVEQKVPKWGQGMAKSQIDGIFK